MPFAFCIVIRIEVRLTKDFVDYPLVVKAHLSYLIVYWNITYKQ